MNAKTDCVYDLAFLGNILHHFARPTADQFIGKVYERLSSGSQIIIWELIDQSEKLDTAAACFSLLFYITSNSRCFTIEEIREIVESGGFVDFRMIRPPTGTTHALFLATKPAKSCPTSHCELRRKPCNLVDPSSRRQLMQVKQVFSAYDGQETTQAGLFKYCPVCAKQLALKDRAGKQRPECPNCGFVHYRNPVPGVVVLVEKEGCILLGKRRGGIQQGEWCLPQGYIEFEEDFLSAAIREVKEETGLDVEIQLILNVVSNLLSPNLHTLTIVMLARVLSGELYAGDDLEMLTWIPNTEPLPEMAFAADKRIIKIYRQSKLEEGLSVDPDFARPSSIARG